MDLLSTHKCKFPYDIILEVIPKHMQAANNSLVFILKRRFMDVKNSDDALSAINGGIASMSLSGPKVLPFSLYREDDFDSYVDSELILKVDDSINSMDEKSCDPGALLLSGGVINRDNLQSGLNPIRNIDILPQDLFLLIKSQQKLISGEDHIATIANVCRQQSESRGAMSSGHGSGQGGIFQYFDFSHELFGGDIPSKCSRDVDGDERSRGRSRSRSQSRKSKGGASASLDDKSQERTYVDSNQSTLRSRSYSGGPRRSIAGGGGANNAIRKTNSNLSSSAQSGGNKPPLSTGGSSNSVTTECLSARKAVVEDDDEEVSNPFSTLSCIPPEVRSYFSGKLGPIDGIWLSAHPLSLLPQTYYKTLNNIQAFPVKDLPANKKSEWELDLLREYDDTRMEKYEEFLVRCRKNPEKQINKFLSKYESANKKDAKDTPKKKSELRREKSSN
jgi:hypothetical protein